MANILEDGMASMMVTLLKKAGTPCGYVRESMWSGTTPSVVMHKRPQQPMLIDNGNGAFIEVLVTDFLTDPATLPYGEPIKGDRITDGCDVFSVQSLTNGKVFRQMAVSLMRIHTVKVA